MAAKKKQQLNVHYFFFQICLVSVVIQLGGHHHSAAADSDGQLDRRPSILHSLDGWLCRVRCRTGRHHFGDDGLDQRSAGDRHRSVLRRYGPSPLSPTSHQSQSLAIAGRPMDFGHRHVDFQPAGLGRQTFLEGMLQWPRRSAPFRTGHQRRRPTGDQ